MENCNIKMTSSLGGFIPASGLQISSYQILRSINSTFYRETRISTFKPKICPYCGIHFLAREYTYKRLWTNDEDNKLKKLVGERKTYFEISKELKRTGLAIKRRCFDLKINKPKRTPPKLWTETQKKLLKEFWLKGYEPCVIQEKINRSDREIISYLERFQYFGMSPQKFN